MIIYRIITLSCLILTLTNCQVIWKKSSSQPTSSSTDHTNLVDENAKKVAAKYAKKYNLSGNIVAHYPDFNMRLLSTHIKGTDTISVFEISSKNGLERERIHCSTKDPEKKHLYIEGMHFFYHSDQPGKINIYIPSMLMATN